MTVIKIHYYGFTNSTHVHTVIKQCSYVILYSKLTVMHYSDMFFYTDF